MADRRPPFCWLILAALIAVSIPAQAARKVVNGKIAFRRDGHIWTMNPDGTEQTLFPAIPTASEPAWSPDGKQLAVRVVQAGFASDIFVINSDGTNLRQLTNAPGFDNDPAWSADGKKIAFSSTRDGDNFEIYVMNADGSNQTRLTFDARVRSRFPAWSPAGKIVFESDGDIVVMHADGSGRAQLTSGANPFFSPDGSKVVFCDENSFLGVKDRCEDVFVINADGSHRTKLTFEPAEPDDAPVFSPDGTKIAFESKSTPDDDGHIEVMSANGTSRVVIATDAREPAWAPAFSDDTTGVYRPATGQWFLRNSNTAGPADITLTYGGQAGDLPVAGDWNGDGRTDIGIFRNGTFSLGTLQDFGCTILGCVATTTVVHTFSQFTFGQAGDLPVAGDWNGDGQDDVGVFRVDAAGAGFFILRVPQFVQSCSICPSFFNGFAEESHRFGGPGALPVAGDWDGDGKDTVGLFIPGTVGVFLLTNDFLKSELSVEFGTTGDRPLTGNWTGQAFDLPGVFRPAARSGGQMLLSTTLSPEPDIAFAFGAVGDLPVAGHWTRFP